MGVVIRVHECFATLIGMFTSSTVTEMIASPTIYIDQLFHIILETNMESDWKQLSTTRRSAGIPVLFLSLVQAYRKDTHKHPSIEHISYIIKLLTEENLNISVSQQVHLFNCVK